MKYGYLFYRKPYIAKISVLQGASHQEAAQKIEYAMKIKDNREFIAESKNLAKPYDWNLAVKKIMKCGA